jgi:putative amidase-like protein
MKRLLVAGVSFMAFAALALSPGAIADPQPPSPPPSPFPLNQERPSILGAPEVGETLTADRGSWTGEDPMTFTYSWERCPTSATGDDPIGCVGVGAGSSYQVVSADTSWRVRLVVRASNFWGDAQAGSIPTSIVDPGDTAFSTEPNAAELPPPDDPEPQTPAPEPIAGEVANGVSPASVPPDGGGGIHINRAAIRDYAVQFVGDTSRPTSSQGYNGAYPVFYDNDCQNFVSQALRAGGWVDTPTFSQNAANPRHWFHNSPQISNTWVSVVHFMRFAQSSNRGRFVRYWSLVELGDVVMVDWSGPGAPYDYHSMVVTRIDGVVGDPGWDIRLTYHTNNRLHKSLRSLMASPDNSNAVWWAFNLYDFY